jgi:hypothetical protein
MLVNDITRQNEIAIAKKLGYVVETNQFAPNASISYLKSPDKRYTYGMGAHEPYLAWNATPRFARDIEYTLQAIEYADIGGYEIDYGSANEVSPKYIEVRLHGNKKYVRVTSKISLLDAAYKALIILLEIE